MVNHSCHPNCCIRTVESEKANPAIELYSLREISANEELTHSYLDIYQPRTARQSALQRTYFFSCYCERCAEQESDASKAFEELVAGVKLSAEGKLNDKIHSFFFRY